MEPKPDHNLGIDHPTTKVDENPDDLHTIQGIIKYDQETDSYELVALEYDGEPMRGETALAVYEADLEQIYGDEFATNSLDTGDTTWEEVREKLNE